MKIITIVDKSEYQKLMNFINREDPKAFVTIYNVSSVQYAPCILYDLDGYYTGLRMLLGHMIETGLSSEERQKGIYFAKDLAEIKAILNR